MCGRPEGRRLWPGRLGVPGVLGSAGFVSGSALEDRSGDREGSKGLPCPARRHPAMLAFC